MDKLKQFREDLATRQGEIETILKSESYTPEQRTRLSELNTEVDTLRNDIQTLEIAERNAIKQVVIPGAAQNNETEKREINQFSMLKFFNGASRGKLEGFEAEMHQEAVNEMRNSEVKNVDPNKFGIPEIVLRNIGARFEKRAHTAGTDSEGGYMVAVEKGGLIQPFIPDAIISRLGATVLSDLKGDLSLPRDTNMFSMAWEAENGDNDNTDKTFDEVTLTPHRMAGYADLSRRLLIQTSTALEQYAQQQFIAAVNSTLDAAAINGSGSSNQPTGILATSGIGSVVGGTNGAVPDWADIVGLETAVNIDNALVGNLAYITTPGIKGLLKQTLKSSGVGGYIWDNEGMNGYSAYTSTNVPSTLTKGSASGVAHAILFGNWSDLLVGKWGGVFVLVDPYTQAGASKVRIHTELQCDVAVRHAESFAAMKDALLS